MDEDQSTREQTLAPRVPRITAQELKKATMDLMTYDTRQVSEIMQMSRMHILGLLRDQKLKGYKEGTSWRVPYRNIREYQLRKQSEAPADHARQSAISSRSNFPNYKPPPGKNK